MERRAETRTPAHEASKESSVTRRTRSDCRARGFGHQVRWRTFSQTRSTQTSLCSDLGLGAQISVFFYGKGLRVLCSGKHLGCLEREEVPEDRESLADAHDTDFPHARLLVRHQLTQSIDLRTK